MTSLDPGAPDRRLRSRWFTLLPHTARALSRHLVSTCFLVSPVIPESPLFNLVSSGVHELYQSATIFADVIPGNSLLLDLTGSDQGVTPHHRSLQHEGVTPVYLGAQHEIKWLDSQVLTDKHLDVLTSHKSSLSGLGNDDSAMVLVPG